MTSSQTLTEQTHAFRLPLPKGKAEVLYFDEGKPSVRAQGLALRIREGGSRKWVYLYRWYGKLQKITIGDASDNPAGWTLKKARARATELRVMVDGGKNPRAEIERLENEESNSKTFKETMTAYLAARAPHIKPRTYDESERHLEKYWKQFHKRAVHEIDAGMIADRLKEIETQNGPVARNRIRSSLSAMFAWAIGERSSRHLKANPVDGTVKVDEGKSRDRVLNDEEVVKIWKAAPDNNYGRVIKLLMLTGQRREEIGGLRWSEVNSEKMQLGLSPERTKNGRPHDVPLSDLALDVLGTGPRIHGSNFVFGRRGYSDWSKAKAALDNACGVTQWTVHDLRRTAATRMADLGVQPHIIEAVLNHVSGHKAGLAGIYNRSAHAPEKRAALELWANHIQAITTPKPKSVSARAIELEVLEAEGPRATFAERAAWLTKARARK